MFYGDWLQFTESQILAYFVLHFLLLCILFTPVFFAQMAEYPAGKMPVFRAKYLKDIIRHGSILICLTQWC